MFKPDLSDFLGAVSIGALCLIGLMLAFPNERVKYIYDDEARLVGYCQGKYLIREEEDEFPSGCYFIEPISWEG